MKLLALAALFEAVAAAHVKLEFDKYTGETFESALRRRDSSEKIDLKKQQSFYAVELMLGTPPQNLSLVLDTGSSDMWVMGSNNPYCKRDLVTRADKNDDDDEEDDDSDDGAGAGNEYPTASADIPQAQRTVDCQKYGVFNMDDSSSVKSNETAFYANYGDNSYANGLWVTDVVNLGGLNVTDLLFAVANVSNTTAGVLGIGLAALESYVPSDIAKSGGNKQYSNFPMVLKENHAIDKVAYSLFLNKQDADKGQILFGAVDHSKYSGNLYTLPLVNSLYDHGVKTPQQLEITLNGIGLQTSQGQVTLFQQKLPALLDSGSTVSYLPIELHKQVAAQLHGSVDNSTGAIKLQSCPAANDTTKLVFDFGGAAIYTDLSSFLERQGSVCSLNIVGQPSNGILLGDNFLSSAYVVFDLESKEISIAQARYDDSPENIEAIVSTVPSAIKAPGYSATFSTFPSSYTTGGNIFTFNQTKSASKTKTSTKTSAGTSTTSTSTKKNSGTRSVSSMLMLAVSMLLMV